MFRTLNIILILLLSAFYACKEDVVTFEEIDTGYNYFPVNKGHYVVYNIDSIVYNDFTGTVDTFSFRLKELIESEFVDDEGRIAQRIERYKRLSDTLPWTLTDVWHSVRTSSSAEKTEENVRYLKLSFPVKKNNKWNGNIFNTLDEQTYKYTSVNQPYSNQLMAFDSAVTVLQNDYSTLISKDYAVEVYAKNVGLVYKKYVSVKKEITGVIKQGVDYTLTATEYGN